MPLPTHDEIEILCWRKRRNSASALATLIFAAGVFGTFPRFVSRHDELVRLNKEIVSLQQLILLNQSETRKAQANIIHMQSEFAKISKHQ